MESNIFILSNLLRARMIYFPAHYIPEIEKIAILTQDPIRETDQIHLQFFKTPSSQPFATFNLKKYVTPLDRNLQLVYLFENLDHQGPAYVSIVTTIPNPFTCIIYYRCKVSKPLALAI